MKRKEFDNILNECLERVLTEGETVEQCLASYPDHASELEPLLQTALFDRKASAVKPRLEFRDRATHSSSACARSGQQWWLVSWCSCWQAAVRRQRRVIVCLMGLCIR